jgi:3-oxoacyl-[acyl-carrier protein] reductase
VKLEGLGLEGRVAIVTGGSRGIGRAVVELFADLGANVVVNYQKDPVAADASVNAARERGVKAESFKADVADVAEAQHLIDFSRDRFKRIDLLVCNAGIWEGSPVETMTDAMWDRTMEINLKGTWTVCRAVIPEMKKFRYGKIVIVSSTAGQRGEANHSNYAASKGGQIAFTKSLAEELAGWGINVNAVAPGWVDTEMSRDALGDSEKRAKIARTIPVGRIATAKDIAGPIAFLCSDWARHINGEILNVNGGSVLCG